jgi:sulfatase modifying factor 1
MIAHPMQPTRRRFLTRLTGAAGLVATVPRGAAARQARAISGASAGEERIVEGVKLCWCPPGRFVMGSPAQERGHRPDEAQVEVVLTQGFWTAKYEATQAEWTRVIGEFPDRPPTEEFGLGDDLPMYWVNFDEAEAFCATLTRRAQASGSVPPTWAFSLPTEAQWEYACRAGTTTATAFGDGMQRGQANIGVDRGGDRRVRPTGRSTRVGSYPSNAWGLHDMHGNVWEWCRDWYHAHLPGGADPDRSAQPGVQNRDGTYSRVRRGGAWSDEPWACRSACRLRYESHRRSDHIGFRVLLVERPRR